MPPTVIERKPVTVQDLLRSAGLDRPYESRFAKPQIVINQPPPSTRNQAYMQQLVGRRQMSDADPATAPLVKN